jgi:hypothetical protein
MLKAMSGAAGLSKEAFPVSLYLTPAVAVSLVLGVIFSVPILTLGKRRFEAAPRSELVLTVVRGLSFCSIVALFTVSAAYLSARTYNPFIYFRF